MTTIRTRTTNAAPAGWVNRSQLFAAATAISAMGFLVFPATAQAKPMVPLAPACNKYEFAGLLELKADNGVTVQVPTSGTTVGPGKAMYAIFGRTEATFGNVYGGINGRNINFTAHWDAGLGAGLTSTYTGQIDDDGFARGTTKNNLNHTNSWRNNDKNTFRCTTTPPPVVAPPPAGGGGVKEVGKKPFTVVGEDVNVYDRPNWPEGVATFLGILREGAQVLAAGSGCRMDDWCEVKGPDVPGGQGFIWGHLQRQG